MRKFIFRKISYMGLSLFVVVTATFFLMKLIPGDPFMQEQAMPREIWESLREHYHLNDPIPVQYGRYLTSLAKFDLGPSFKYRSRTVNQIIAQGFPVSAILGGQAFLVALTMGILLGIWSALKHQRWQDYVFMFFAVLGLSIPNFLLATFFQYLFAVKIHLFPIARWGSFAHTILPTLALAAHPMAFIARLTKSEMLEVLKQDYMKTARAKGLGMWATVMRHGLRNALLPVLTYLGPLLANILVGSFIVEKIFGIPGLGQWFVNGIINRDYTVIMGMTIFYSCLLLGSVFLVEVGYALLNPRIRRRA